LLFEGLEEHTASIVRAEVSQVGIVANCAGWEEGRIDLHKEDWPITTTDGEKGQGPNCSYAMTMAQFAAQLALKKLIQNGKRP